VNDYLLRPDGTHFSVGGSVIVSRWLLVDLELLAGHR
jgi:lysophospholipase L1-like esterase